MESPHFQSKRQETDGSEPQIHPSDRSKNLVPPGRYRVGFFSHPEFPPEVSPALPRIDQRAGGPGSLFSIHLRAVIEERIPLLQYAGSLRKEGAPRVGFTRGSLYLTVTIDP